MVEDPPPSGGYASVAISTGRENFNFFFKTGSATLSPRESFNALHDADDSLPVHFTQARPRRQAQPVGKKIPGHRASNHPRIGKHRLEVHRLPHRPSFDVFFLKGDPNILSCGTEFVGIDSETRQPPGAAPIGSLRHEVDPGQRSEGLLVSAEILAAAGDSFLQHVELASSHRCGAVVGVYPDVFMLDTAVRVARDLGLPFVPYLHDTVAEALDRSRLAKLGRRVHGRVLENAASYLVATDGMAALYREKYRVEAVAVEHIYPEKIPREPPRGDAEQALFWSGNIYAINKDAIRRVFLAASRRSELEFRFATQQSRESLARLGLQGEHVKVTYIPVRERDRYLEMIRSQAVLVLALDWPHESTMHEDELRTIFPTKTPEYLASGRPILCHCPSHYYLARFLREHECAEVVSEPNDEAVARGLDRILGKPGRAEQLGRAGLNAARIFESERVAPIFHRVVENTIKSPR